MIVWFSTVVRSAPPMTGGELVKLDWTTKTVLARATIAPIDPTLDDPNPRGNTRGGRGIQLLPSGEVLVASYHSLLFFDRDLTLLRSTSHPMMVSLHEHAMGADGKLWTSSTAVDAALQVDLESGRVVRAVHPREMRGIQAALSVAPLDFNKDADNRVLFLGAEHYQHKDHLHLNAVALFQGELLALFSKHGVIANLDQDRVIVKDKGLRGSHNLVIDEEGLAWVSHTVHRGVLAYDLSQGTRARRISFGDAKAVRRIARLPDLGFRVQKRLASWGLRPHTPPRPVFVRGLFHHGEHVFVGISPATILQIDRNSGDVVDHFTYSRDVNACVHGLAVERPDVAQRRSPT